MLKIYCALSAQCTPERVHSTEVPSAALASCVRVGMVGPENRDGSGSGRDFFPDILLLCDAKLRWEWVWSRFFRKVVCENFNIEKSNDDEENRMETPKKKRM